MRASPRLITAFLLTACGTKSEETATGDTSTTPLPQTTPTGDTAPTDPQGACGDPVLYDLTVLGVVIGPTGDPSPGAHVVLEDRAWTVGDILGEAYTDTDGVFSLAVADLTSLEDCWGLLGYYIEADKGTFYTERGINNQLFNAIMDASFVTDLSLFPLVLEESTP